MRRFALAAFAATPLLLAWLLRVSGLSTSVFSWVWSLVALVLQVCMLRLPLTLAEQEFAAAAPEVRARAEEIPSSWVWDRWAALLFAVALAVLLVAGRSLQQPLVWWRAVLWCVSALAGISLIIGKRDSGTARRQLPQGHARGPIFAVAVALAVLHFFIIFLVFLLIFKERTLATDAVNRPGWLIFGSLPGHVATATVTTAARGALVFVVPAWLLAWVGRIRNRWRLFRPLLALVTILLAPAAATAVISLTRWQDDPLAAYSLAIVVMLAAIWFYVLRLHLGRKDIRRIAGRLYRYVFYSCVVTSILATVGGILTYGTKGVEAYGGAANNICRLAFVTSASMWLIWLWPVLIQLYYDYDFPDLRRALEPEFRDQQSW